MSIFLHRLFGAGEHSFQPSRDPGTLRISGNTRRCSDCDREEEKVVGPYGAAWRKVEYVGHA